MSARRWLSTFLLPLALALPLRAGVLDDVDQALSELRHPRWGRQARVTSLTLPLAAGYLSWERGLCRVLPLRIGDDSLLVVELSGRGRLQLAFPDSLERIAARAALGRRCGDKRLKRATLVLDHWPADWAGLAWAPLKPPLPFLRVAPPFGRERLARLDPDNPLLRPLRSATVLLPDSAGHGAHRQRIWLLTDPGEWIMRQQDGLACLSQPLHAGSSVTAPVTGPQSPTLATPELGADSLRLRVTRQGPFAAWNLELGTHRTDPLLYLLLDPRAELTQAEWIAEGTTRPARTSRALPESGPSPWLVVETIDASAPTRLHLTGRSSRSLAVIEAPGRRRVARANWFPRLPWWERPVLFRLEDPDSLIPVFLTEGLRGSMDGRATAWLQPEERVPVPLGSAAALCWTPLREQAGFHVPQPARVRHFTPDIANLDLPRERGARPPSHEEPAEPVDLSQGADTLSQGILQESLVLDELRAAAGRLEAWLGGPPRPVLLSERRERPDRREEEDGLLAHDLPPEMPLEIDAQDLRSAASEARLTRLETLCRGWWLPESLADESAPRWIRWGAARACALLLLEEARGAETARELRRRALESELTVFTANAAASRLALGERAEGSWRSAATQERLAWRFALLLENLRWRLRDPRSLDDALYRQFLVELRLRLRWPGESRAALAELKAATADFLVANERLQAAGFADAPALWNWLEAECNRWELPTLTVTPGRVETPEGPRLALRTAWDRAPAPSTVLPVLVRTAQGYTAWSLGVSTLEEQFTLPLDPAEILGLQVAPGGSLPARVHVR